MADYALLMVAINYDWIAARDNDPVTLKQEEEILKRLIKEYPKSIRLGDAYLYLGQIYSSHGGVKIKAIDCKKAIDFYNLAIKNTYRDWVKAQAKTRIAQCYEIFGNKEKAADIYEEIVAKYPDTEIAKDVQEMLKGWNTLFDAGLVLEKQKNNTLSMPCRNRGSSSPNFY